LAIVLETEESAKKKAILRIPGKSGCAAIGIHPKTL
jgi:hypothetical protein